MTTPTLPAAIKSPTLPGLLPDAEAQRIVDNVVRFWPDDGSPAVLRREVVPDERMILEARRLRLHALLRPMREAGEELRRAAEAIAATMMCFTSMRNVEDPQGLIAAYVQAMSDLPIFAVLAACEDAKAGKIKGQDSDFMPSTALMIPAAEKRVFPVEGERLMIQKTLDGKVADPELTREQKDKLHVGLRAVADAITVEKGTRMPNGKFIPDDRTPPALRDSLNASTQAKILAEYRRLKRDPVYADKARTILLSPALAGPVRQQRRRG